ncbi:unnamed protein product [Anisakis simplex]|uniref:Uncharacterized protein n=1 Tax=Anisakis simplex TaxID=6269 RepID=A0A0M3KHC3_ANISI|nr:unnamed protein product [Anisakis simplex]
MSVSKKFLEQFLYGINYPHFGSTISEEDVQHLTEIEEKLAKVEEASRSASPTPDPPPPAPAPPPFQKRHSLLRHEKGAHTVAFFKEKISFKNQPQQAKQQMTSCKS